MSEKVHQIFIIQLFRQDFQISSSGTGVGISSGEISIGQAVATSSNVQFANLTLSGNLTVNGSTVVNPIASNTTIEDALIELGSGNSGSNSNDLGLILERGSTDNGFIGFDESADQFVVATTTATGGSSGDLTLTDVTSEQIRLQHHTLTIVVV